MYIKIKNLLSLAKVRLCLITSKLFRKNNDASVAAKKRAKAETHALSEAIKQYTIIKNLIHQFFDEIVKARNYRSHGNPLNVAISKMLCKKPILDNLFYEFLKLLGVSKIKNLKYPYTAQDIFNIYRNEIVRWICKEPNELDISFYKYTLFSFYISQCKMLEAIEIDGTNFPALGLFFEESYSGIYFLLTIYSDTLAFQKYGYSISDGERLGKSNNKHESELLSLIGHTLYVGTPLDNGFAAPGETAMLCIRHFIEVWLRKTFNAWKADNGRYITVSEILTVLKNNMNKIKNDPIVGQLSTFETDINTLKHIYKGSNYFIHSPQRQLFWIPHIVYMYLQQLRTEYANFYLKTMGTMYAIPPLIPNQCDCWQNISDDIKKL